MLAFHLFTVSLTDIDLRQPITHSRIHPTHAEHRWCRREGARRITKIAARIAGVEYLIDLQALEHAGFDAVGGADAARGQ